MLPSRRLSATFVALWILVLGVVACGSPLRTAVCGLNTYGTAIQAQLQALLALDPAQVAQAGTPDNAAANDAIDALDQAAADGQKALDAASEDEVGDRIRGLFQAALDLTTAATQALQAAIDSGDPATVTAAMGDVQRASDAIQQFLDAAGDIDCPSPEPSATESVATPTLEPTAEPTPEPTLEPTPEPTLEPTPEPTEVETAEPTEEPTRTPRPTATPTEEPTETPEPTATPTLEPTPVPTPTLSQSPSASATATASASASPAPEPTDNGTGGLLPWVVGIGLLGGGAAAIYFWYRSNQNPPPDDGLGPDGTPLPDGGGAIEDAEPGADEGAEPPPAEEPPA